MTTLTKKDKEDKILSVKEIRDLPHKSKRYSMSIQKGSGASVIIEKEQCKRFVGVIRNPSDNKQIQISLGVLGIDVNKMDDLTRLLNKWVDCKKWVKSTKKHPKDFFIKDEDKKSTVTLDNLIDGYLKYYKKTVVERTFNDRKRKFNQSLKFFGNNISLTEFEYDRGGREKCGTLITSLKSRNKHEHTIRMRSLLGQCFEWGEKKGIFTRGQNPCADSFPEEKVDYKPRNHPRIKWEEVPELFEKINSSSNSIITKSSIKLYFMTCIRVSVIVGMKWEWIDEDNNMIVVPPDTTGLKRIKNRRDNPEYEHYIPLTDEIKKVLDDLKPISGHQEYVFWTPDCRKLPHQHPESINRYLQRLGYKGRQNAHGWRKVVVTEGQQICKTDRDIIERQIGHTTHKSGAIGSYDNTQFLDQRREFLEKWCKELVKQGLQI